MDHVRGVPTIDSKMFFVFEVLYAAAMLDMCHLLRVYHVWVPPLLRAGLVFEWAQQAERAAETQLRSMNWFSETDYVCIMG